MPIIDLFSRRQQKLRGEVQDILVYESMPKALRVQLVHIFRGCLGSESDHTYHENILRAYRDIVESLCYEYGVFLLPGTSDSNYRDYYVEFFTFILGEVIVDRVLDAVELACRFIDVKTRSWNYRKNQYSDRDASIALAEINTRFQQHGFGFRYEASNIIRIDSEVVHAEVIKPALALLHDAKYKGAEAEFHLAFEHYRHGRSKEALAECLKSLESTAKAIAKTRGWQHPPNATVKPLLDIMFEKELIPVFWSSQFSGIRAMLESGVPTARNRLGGHGQGADIVEVPPHIVAFTLHQTAACIVFLASAELLMP